MGRTALIVAVPEAPTDPTAARGVPAHVTVLFPFANRSDVDEDALAELFDAHAAFDFVLDRIERWESAGIVWLHPEPSQPFEELTRAVWRRWPDHPPYEGKFDDIIPHLTIGETPIALDLPIPARVVEVTLIEEQSDGTWATRRAFPLADR